MQTVTSYVHPNGVNLRGTDLVPITVEEANEIDPRIGESVELDPCPILFRDKDAVWSPETGLFYRKHGNYRWKYWDIKGRGSWQDEAHAPASTPAPDFSAQLRARRRALRLQRRVQPTGT
jgi:hypothetical protein